MRETHAREPFRRIPRDRGNGVWQFVRKLAIGFSFDNERDAALDQIDKLAKSRDGF